MDDKVGRAFFGRFQELTPIQSLAIDPILSGSDVLIRSATASGKTEAALAPLVSRYWSNLVNAKGVTIVVVTPTRALINDVVGRLIRPISQLQLSIGTRHGERDQLRNAFSPNIVVTTPESFDIIVGKMPKKLSGVCSVVLDEAHLLFNTQRGFQFAITMSRLEKISEHSIQFVALSATIGNAIDVWRFFRPSHSVVDVPFLAPRNLEYQVRYNLDHSRLADLILRHLPDSKVLIFTNSRFECELLAQAFKTCLQKTSKIDSHDVYVHHAALDKSRREDVEERFKAPGQPAVCVATSTLELGIDIGDVDLVVLYGLPPNWQSLVQRIGRGNRRRGVVEALMCVRSASAPDMTPSLVDALGFHALIDQSGSRSSVQRNQQIFGAVAQQFCSVILSRGTYVRFEELTALVENWSHVDRETCIEILNSLAKHGVLQKHPVYDRFGPSDELYSLEDSWGVWSNFSQSSVSCDLRHDHRIIASIPLAKAAKLSVGEEIIVGGSRFRIGKKLDKSRTVFVVPSKNESGPTKDVLGTRRGIVRDDLLPEWVRRFLVDNQSPLNVKPPEMENLLQGDLGFLNSLSLGDQIPFFETHEGFNYLTFAGVTINRFVASKVTNSRYNGTIIQSRKAIDFSGIVSPVATSLHSLDPGDPDSLSTFQKLLPERLLLAETRSSLAVNPIYLEVLRRLEMGTREQIDKPIFHYFSSIDGPLSGE